MFTIKSIIKREKPRRKMVTGVFLILLLALVLAGCSQPNETNVPQTSSQINATREGGDLIIQISDISKKATFYPVEVDGTKLEVIAVEAPDGSIRTAFNTCQVCYDSGKGYYKQEGDVLVCQNCPL